MGIIMIQVTFSQNPGVFELYLSTKFFLLIALNFILPKDVDYLPMQEAIPEKK